MATGPTLGALLARAPAALRLTGRPPPGTLRRRVASVGWFNPEHPASVQVLGQAAADDLADRPARERRELPGRLRRRGMSALVLTGALAPLPSKPLWSRAGIACLRSGASAPRTVLRLRQALAGLNEVQAEVHGVLLAVHRQGVLLTGPAGTGKGGLALELLRRGHALVADDVVQLVCAADGVLVGSAPSVLRGYLETRDLGILDVRGMYGARALRRSQRVDLVVRLKRRGGRLAAAARLAGRRGRARLLDVDLPQVSIPVRGNAATRVEALALDHAVRATGVDASDALDARQRQRLRAAGA